MDWYSFVWGLAAGIATIVLAGSWFLWLVSRMEPQERNPYRRIERFRAKGQILPGQPVHFNTDGTVSVDRDPIGFPLVAVPVSQFKWQSEEIGPPMHTTRKFEGTERDA